MASSVRAYDCLYACHGRDRDGQHATWRCLAGKHGHDGEHRFGFEHPTGEPFIDEPAQTSPGDIETEINALTTIVRALFPFPASTRQRMMRYLLDRFGVAP